jgi:hypothetical protein
MDPEDLEVPLSQVLANIPTQLAAGVQAPLRTQLPVSGVTPPSTGNPLAAASQVAAAAQGGLRQDGHATAGSLLQSAGAGAAAGAAIGSIIPGIGTAIGGGVGAVVGLVADGWNDITDFFSSLF